MLDLAFKAILVFVLVSLLLWAAGAVIGLVWRLVVAMVLAIGNWQDDRFIKKIQREVRRKSEKGL
jgi:hypothetical protein